MKKAGARKLWCSSTFDERLPAALGRHELDGQQRRRMTRELAAKTAIRGGRGPVDFTAFLKTLKK
jgi:hypothetical protein